MVCSNYLRFWLTALLLFEAVLPLVHGWYPTCPTTRGKTLFETTDLQNPASYAEKRCNGSYKCCAQKGLFGFSVAINIWCSDSCGSPQVDCSIASNNCRNVSDITGYYKSSAFISCPYDSDIKWRKTPGTVDTKEMLCPATDTCGVAIFVYATVQHGYRYSPVFGCMDSCKQKRAERATTRIPKGKTISSDCTACSSTDDCKKKLAELISRPTCPTTKGRELSTKREIENVNSYEEKMCTGSDKCCAQKSTIRQLMIRIECSASCRSPKLDCSIAGNKCRNAAEIARHFKSSGYVTCPSYWSSFDNRDFRERHQEVLCLADKCAVGKFLSKYSNKFIYVSGCMRGCKLNEIILTNRSETESSLDGTITDCKPCSTTDDCEQKLLQSDWTTTAGTTKTTPETTTEWNPWEDVVDLF